MLLDSKRSVTVLSSLGIYPLMLCLPVLAVALCRSLNLDSGKLTIEESRCTKIKPAHLSRITIILKYIYIVPF